MQQPPAGKRGYQPLGHSRVLILLCHICRDSPSPSASSIHLCTSGERRRPTGPFVDSGPSARIWAPTGTRTSSLLLLRRKSKSHVPFPPTNANFLSSLLGSLSSPLTRGPCARSPQRPRLRPLPAGRRRFVWCWALLRQLARNDPSAAPNRFLSDARRQVSGGRLDPGSPKSPNSCLWLRQLRQQHPSQGCIDFLLIVHNSSPSISRFPHISPPGTSTARAPCSANGLASRISPTPRLLGSHHFETQSP